MGRKRMWEEDMGARFPKGTFAQIERVIEEDETRTDFVRVAVEREIDRRKQARKAKRARAA